MWVLFMLIIIEVPLLIGFLNGQTQEKHTYENLYTYVHIYFYISIYFNS
jgi:hypothetical protein